MASCSVLAEKRGLNLPVFGNQVISCAWLLQHVKVHENEKWIEKCVLRWIHYICSKDNFFCTVMRVRIYAS